MKHIFTLSLCFLALSLSAQTEYPYPYNPDGNNDGLISLNDLMDLLALYGLEYNAGVLATDSISAIYYTGEMDYWDCASSCVGLSGNWKVLDHHLVGSYKGFLNFKAWLDHGDFDQYFRTYNNTFNVPVLEYDFELKYSGTNAINHCFCQTRTRADIEDINLCEGLEDECGVCNGEGAIYECGCTDIPEGDCDCNGNQLDAIGVCGGDCLEDLDGDGVCDPVLGPCEGQAFVSYHGYDYDIVETADGRCWFAENLRTNKFSDGFQIPYVSSPSEVDAMNGQYGEHLCCLSPSFVDMTQYVTASGLNYSSMYQNYPMLQLSVEMNNHVYNFGAVISERGLCPSGWNIPSMLELSSLVNSVADNFGDQVYALGGPVTYDAASEYVDLNSSGFGLLYPIIEITSSGNFNEDGRLHTKDIAPSDGGAVGPSSDKSQTLEFNYGFPSATINTHHASMNSYQHVRCIKD